MRPVFIFLCALCVLLPIASYAAKPAKDEAFIARTLVALYDGRYEDNLRSNSIHRFVEMPANRLGYDVRYHDVSKPLPTLGKDVHGIILWFHHDPVPDVAEYLKWLQQALQNGKKIIILENMGVGVLTGLDDESLNRLKYINERLGYRDVGAWNAFTHKSTVLYSDKSIMDFERIWRPTLPPFQETVVTSQGKSHLRVSLSKDLPGRYADLVVTGPQGGFATAGYVYHEQDIDGRTVSAWYINPFNFLKASLKPPVFPVPDVTTLVGLRIFYSHIDGDGWNNPTHIENYRDKFASSADVIEQEILRHYPDFAFSVGVVAGDIALDCFGSEKSRATARSTLALPNVEAASHTYTHPLFWQFFEHYSLEKEAVFSANYPKKAGLFSQNFSFLLKSGKDTNHHKHPETTIPSVNEMREAQPLKHTEEEQLRELYDMYSVPRSYNCLPFDEEREIVTARKMIQELAPEGKKVKLIQWSGNTSPYTRFLKKTREEGLLNINGGESRFDGEYPSYSTIYPIGINLDGERQIYSTASNENTYTNLWSERFFGYRYLIETVKHTEHPMRITPFNVYFHSYSGERQASVRALKEIMDFARTQDVIPIITSAFAEIANGFYSTRIETMGRNHWKVLDRGALQTLRLDALKGLSVDMTRSKGVLGQRFYQENLYIFLNPVVDKPEIKLIHEPLGAKSKTLSLTSSRWNVLSAQREGKASIKLKAQGYGKGEMRWRVPADGTYLVIMANHDGEHSQEVTAVDGEITFDFGGLEAIQPVDIRINPIEAAQ